MSFELNKRPQSLTQQQIGEKERPQMVGRKRNVKTIFGYLPG